MPASLRKSRFGLLFVVFIPPYCGSVGANCLAQSQSFISQEVTKDKDRYNADHSSFNSAFGKDGAGSSPELLQSITGDKLTQDLPARLAGTDAILEELINRGSLEMRDGVLYWTESGLPYE